MATLFCFGLGYSASHYIHGFGARFDRIAGTVTTREKAAHLAAAGIGGHKVEAFVFDGTDAAPEVTAALTDADALLVSAPPTEDGDPVLVQFAGTIAGAPQLETIVYLSTIGVYGDHGGEWVDEETPPAPVSERSGARLAAEQQWQALGLRAGRPVAILRLAGIYGPGQNALTQMRSGRAKRIDKPGQAFNRIHVEDIAQAIEAALVQRADGIFNVTDDEPTPQGVPVGFAAELLGGRKHVRQRVGMVGHRVNVEKHRAGNMRSDVVVLRQRQHARHLERGVDHPDVGIVQVRGEPFGGDERIGGGHVSGLRYFPDVIAGLDPAIHLLRRIS